MTEQEIEQARADVDKLDIEQLRCGVLLQLLHIESLKKEHDAIALEVDQWRVDHHELLIERDALMSAAKLALDALECHAAIGLKADKAITALREAGVQ
jgi:hypothetical protein